MTGVDKKPFLRVVKENLQPLGVENLKYILAESFTKNRLEELQNGKEVQIPAVMS